MTPPTHTETKPTPVLQMEINGIKYNQEYVSARLGCTRADAAYIVQAVNAHEALVKASEAHAYAETLAGKVGYMAALDKARDLVTIALHMCSQQAIAKAEAQS